MLRMALEIQSGIRRDVYGQKEIANAGEILRTLWDSFGEEAACEWVRRTFELLQQEEILFCGLCEQGTCRGENEVTAIYGEKWQTTCKEYGTRCPMCYLWENWTNVGTPQGRESLEQLSRELNKIVYELSQETAPTKTFLCCLWEASQGLRIMFDAFTTTTESGETREGIAANVERSVGAAGGNDVTSTLFAAYGTKWNGNSGAVTGDHFVMDNAERSVRTAGVVSKGNGEAWITPERHMSLTTSGGQAGQGYPCVITNDTPKTMLIRCGKEGGGKGALIQEDKSATLSCQNIQTLFDPNAGIIEQIKSLEFVDVTGPIAIDSNCQDSRFKLTGQIVPTIPAKAGTGGNNGPMLAIPTKVYGIGGYNSEGMKSDNPHSGIYEAKTSRTIDLNGGSPACNQGGMAIVQGYRMTAFGEYADDDSASTVKTRDYKDATDLVCSVDCRNFNETDKHGTLQAKGNGGQSLNYMGAVREGYSVRRLTPLECERLQGFPDFWTDIPGQTEATQEELEFWREVWFTWDKVQAEEPGKVKPRTDNRLLKWLKNPVSDSAQYKALGNSVAVPCPEYVLEGIKEVMEAAYE